MTPETKEAIIQGEIKRQKIAILKAKLSVVEDVWDGEFMSKEEMEQYVDELREDLRIAESKC